MAYIETKVGNGYTYANRKVFMIETVDDVASLPTDCAVDSLAKTYDWGVIASFGVDRQWHIWP